MASFVHLIDQRRLIGAGGSTTSGEIYFYYTGTTVKAPIYSDAALLIPMANPVVVAAGAIIPLIFLDDNIQYRRVIDYGDGSAPDTQDPLGNILSDGDIGLPVGSVIDFSGSAPPDGFLFCFGQEISRNSYAELFETIGTQYGAGNGSTTFNLPDYRGRVGAGKDNMGGTAASRLLNSVSGSILGAVGGAEQHVLTLAELASHDHAITITDPGHLHGISVYGDGEAGSVIEDSSTGSPLKTINSNSATTGITADVLNAGSNAAHNNVQPTIVVNKIIKTTSVSFLSALGVNLAEEAASAVAVVNAAGDEYIAEMTLIAASAGGFETPEFATQAAGNAATTEGEIFRVPIGTSPQTFYWYRKLTSGSELVSPLATTAALAAPGGGDLVSEVPAGIAANNVTNDGPALAARTQSVIMPRQTHYISSNTNIDVDIECRPGTLIRIANGVTVTPRAGFSGAKEQIFIPEGTGKIDLRRAKLHEAHSEWWPMPGGDATSAINSALVAHGLVTLFARDYVVTGPILHQTGFTTLRGVDCPSWKQANSATRILSTSTTGTIIQVGVATNPGSANASPNHCHLENLFVQRNAAPNATAAAPGVAVLFSLEAQLSNVHSDTSVYPFFFSGSTACLVRDTRAMRTVACAGGTGTDRWVGYYVEGSSGLSSINSNASLTFDGINYGQCSVAATETTHLKLDGAKTDFFNEGLFETVGGSIGVDVVGSATDGQNNNIDLGRMVLDQGAVRGLRVTNIPAGGRVTAKRLYVGLDTGSGVALQVTGCAGQVSIPEAEIYQGKSTGAAIDISTSAAVDVKAWVKDCRSQAVSLNSVARSTIDVTVQQTAQNLSAGVQAVASVVDCDIAVSAQAALGGRTMDIGYQSLAASNDRNTVNLRKIGTLFSNKKALTGAADATSTFVNG